MKIMSVNAILEVYLLSPKTQYKIKYKAENDQKSFISLS